MGPSPSNHQPAKPSRSVRRRTCEECACESLVVIRERELWYGGLQEQNRGMAESEIDTTNGSGQEEPMDAASAFLMQHATENNEALKGRIPGPCVAEICHARDPLLGAQAVLRPPSRDPVPCRGGLAALASP